MGELLWVFIVFCSIWGFIEFLKWCFKVLDGGTTPQSGQNEITQNVDRRKIFLEELRSIAQITPHKTLHDLLLEMSPPTPVSTPASQSRYVYSDNQTFPELTPQSITEKAPQGRILSEKIIPVSELPSNYPHEYRTDISTKEEVQTPNIEEMWSNWYSENSINLLLYIGAFFIVASASIFVGFQWESINGVLKASLLSILTLSFFVSGLYFYTQPKIKTAGVTFAAIGSFLIPFSGAGWYNFVYKFTDTNFGWVWLITSLTAIGSYIFLAYYFKNKIYTYIASLSSISMLLAVVKINNLNTDFYLLSSIFASYALMLNSFLIKETSEEIKDIFITPLQITANITMPVTLIFGLFIAIGENKLFTLEAGLSVLIAASFYLMLYTNFKKIGYLVTTVALYPLGIFFLSRWLQLTGVSTIYIFAILAYLEYFLAYIYKDREQHEEVNVFASAATIKLLLVFLLAWIIDVQTLHKIIVALLMGCAGGALYVLKKQITSFHLTTIFGTAAVYELTNTVQPLSDENLLRIIAFLLVGVMLYLFTMQKKNEKEYVSVFGSGTILYFGVALLFSFASPRLLALTTTVYALVCLDGFIRTKKTSFLYGLFTAAGVAIAAYILAFVPNNAMQTTATIGYSLTAVLAYFIGIKSKAIQDILNAYIIAVSSYFAIALMLGITEPILFSLVTCMITFLALHAVMHYKLPEIIYVVVLFSSITLYQHLNTYVPLEYLQDMQSISFVLLAVVAYILTVIVKSHPRYLSPLISGVTVYATISFLITYSNEPLLTLISIIITLISMHASSEFRRSELIYLSTVFGSFTTHLFIKSFIPPEYFLETRTLAYLAIAVVLYGATITIKQVSFRKAYAVGSVINVTLACMISLQSPGMLSIVSLTTAALLYHASLEFRASSIIYISNTFFLFGMYSLLQFIGTSSELNPLYYSIFTIGLYALQFGVPETIKKEYRLSGLTISALIPIYYGIFNTGYNQSEGLAISSAYFTTALYGFDAYVNNSLKMKYIASGIGMLTYLWQVKYAGFTETQIYTLPLGLYFMVLGFSEKLHDRNDNYTALDSLGLAFLLFPTIFQSLGDNGVIYTLLALVEGTLILAAGITMKYKNYIYAGTATLVIAVLIRTYEFIFQLPGWAVTAIIGTLFLTLAFYLMLHKKDTTNS